MEVLGERILIKIFDTFTVCSTWYSGNDTAGSKVHVTFHRSRIQVTASLINYHTTHPLDLTEHFVKRLGLGDTFNAIHLSVSW